MDKKTLLGELSADELKELLAEAKRKERDDRVRRREAYEALRGGFMNEARNKVTALSEEVKGFRKWLDDEAGSFKDVMREYGRLRHADQQSFTVIDGDFKLEIACNKVKRFDERADLAAERLMEYLKGYIAKSDKGIDDPLYQLAMTLLERNRQGALDNKNIGKLYSLEDKFDDEYRSIMDLFRESHLVQADAVNYYFYLRDKMGVWRRVEPSFCRL